MPGCPAAEVPYVDTFAELSVLLQRERLLLELLVFKLTELGHLLQSGDPRFLGWAAEEVERAVEAVRLTELERAVHLQSLPPSSLAGAALPGEGPPADESQLLARLVAHAPEPWVAQLAEHRGALTALAEEVALGLRTTRRLAEAGTGVVDALLDRVGTPAAPAPALLTYGPGSTSSWSAPAPRLRATL